jgi:hypothetical protein
MEWTPNKLADSLRSWLGNKDQLLAAANMLLDQAQEINNLKRDLKWAREQWEKDRINLVHQMDGKDVEIENLKSKVSYWKGLHR